MILSAVIVLAAVVLRLLSAADSPLWMDEIWSLRNAVAGGFWEAVSRTTTDNNHPLLSGWLWLLGPEQDAFLYRVPSLVAGILTVWLLAPVGESIKPGLGRVLQIIGALSYPFILCSGEARGYSVMLLCYLAAWLLAGRSAETKSGLWLGFVTGVGLMAHSGFLLLVPSLIIRAQFRWRPLAQVVGISACWYLLFVAALPAGTGAIRSNAEALTEILFMVLTGMLPRVDTIGIVLLCTLSGLVLLLCGVWALRSVPGRTQSITFVTVILVPVAVLVLFDPRVLYLRYFFGAYLWGLVVLALGVQRLQSAANPLFSAAGSLALVVWGAGNLASTFELFHFGRNGYEVALQQLNQRGIEEFSCDNEFRAGLSTLTDRVLCSRGATDTVLFREERLFELSPESEGAVLLHDAPPLSGLRIFLKKASQE